MNGQKQTNRTRFTGAGRYDATDALIDRVVSDSMEFSENADENHYKVNTFAYSAMKENDSLIYNTSRTQFMMQTEQSNMAYLKPLMIAWQMIIPLMLK